MGLKYFTRDCYFKPEHSGILKFEIPIGSEIITASKFEDEYSIQQYAYLRLLLKGDPNAEDSKIDLMLESIGPEYSRDVSFGKIIETFQSGGKIQVLFEILPEKKTQPKKKTIEFSPEETESMKEYKAKSGKDPLTKAKKFTSEFKTFLALANL